MKHIATVELQQHGSVSWWAPVWRRIISLRGWKEDGFMSSVTSTAKVTVDPSSVRTKSPWERLLTPTCSQILTPLIIRCWKLLNCNSDLLKNHILVVCSFIGWDVQSGMFSHKPWITDTSVNWIADFGKISNKWPVIRRLWCGCRILIRAGDIDLLVETENSL